MNVTSLVLAFAGAMAAKVRPAPMNTNHALVKAGERILELEDACDRWGRISEAWEARFERLERENEELRAALEHEVQRRNAEAAHPLLAYYQGGH